ncbi:MAG TPA: trypsin-like peptidase domain-containing protein, partial [Isosphaeraceae bacterium]|jgi:S1-C subfamily serine protease|nr:trypsin-like peptidase domain-containing protein [Isosphaeraceae bacterium]
MMEGEPLAGLKTFGVGSAGGFRDMPYALVLALTVVAQADQPRPANPPSPADVVAALETAIADAITRAEPSVVAISRVKDGEGDETTAIRGRTPRPARRAVPPAALNPRLPGMVIGEPDEDNDDDLLSFDYGSGVVIGDGDQILTAYHVVKGASRLLVRASGHKKFDAEIIAADPRSDLAVIVPVEDDRRGRPGLKPLRLGDATKLRKGGFLIALGNPFNAARDGTPSATWGILSNTARRLEVSNVDDLQGEPKQLRHFPTLLQLDSKLNLGMSGGAVVNLKGELVGITTSLTSASGFDAQAGYAIPIDALTRRTIQLLKQGKEVEYGFIGISLTKAVPNRIQNVAPGTPADHAGLLQGDTIIGVGDVAVNDGDSLILAVNAAPVGDPVRLRVLREDREGEAREIEKTVILSKMPVGAAVIATNRPAPWRGLRIDYTSTLSFGTFTQDVLQAMAKGGVGVTEVITGSPADKVGIRRGQVITGVAQHPVTTPRDFYQAIANRQGPVTLTTDRGLVTLAPDDAGTGASGK